MFAVLLMLAVVVAHEVVTGEAAMVASWADELTSARSVFREFVRRSNGVLGPREIQLAEAQLSDHFSESEDVLARLEGLNTQFPNDIEVALRLADAYSRYEQVDRGLELFESLLERAPSNPSRLNALGFTLADVGRDLDRAEILLRREAGLCSARVAVPLMRPSGPKYVKRASAT